MHKLFLWLQIAWIAHTYAISNILQQWSKLLNNDCLKPEENMLKTRVWESQQFNNVKFYPLSLSVYCPT